MSPRGRGRMPVMRLRHAMALTAVWAALIGYFTLSAPTGGGGMPGLDKIQHFVAFAVLALPLCVARPRWTMLIVAAATFYGGGIELVQPLVGRSAEWADLAADAAGAAVGGLAGRRLRLRREAAALNR